MTSGNRVHWTDRALEGLRTSRKTKSNSPLRGIRAGLGMRFRDHVCQQAQGSRVQTTALPKKKKLKNRRGWGALAVEDAIGDGESPSYPARL